MLKNFTRDFGCPYKLGAECHQWNIWNKKVSRWKDMLSISIRERFCKYLEIRASQVTGYRKRLSMERLVKISKI
jgi:hypothetical protein